MRIGLYIGVGLLIVHGLIHLMGLVAYYPLGQIAELPYKTALLGGRWEIGAAGMRSFGIFWLAAAVGMAGSAVGLALKQEWWPPLLAIAVLLSLIVTSLDWSNAWRGAVLDLIILVPLLLALGLPVQPRPFAAFPQETEIETTVPLPADLPAPVARYYQATMGASVPVVESAVITGRGTVRFAGVTFPARMRFTHAAGRGYRHYIEATVFGVPVLKVNERYLDGAARMELPVGVIENEPKIDMAANLGLWGESIWLPSIFITDPRVRWDAIDDNSARLIVPFEDGEDAFTAIFDPHTGLLTSMEALRYREASDTEKQPWLLEILAWDSYHGIRIPSRSQVTWGDERAPWLIIEVEDIAFNVDVSRYIRSKGE
jgi:hypothetical protein